MMKMIKRIPLAVLLISIFLFQPYSVMAVPHNTVQLEKEYLEDGSYFETIIESNDNFRSSIKNASKTVIYKNDKDQSLWYAKVTADFYYDGTTSFCTSSSASGGTYVDGWKILSKSSSRTGNVASATVVAGCYLNGSFVDSITVKVLLSCDKNGNLS